MKRTYEARKGEVFSAGELAAILAKVDPLSEVKVYSRMNGKPFRVVVDEGFSGDPRPEAVRYGHESPLPVECAGPPRGDDGTDVRPVKGAPTALPDGERRGHYVVEGGRWKLVSEASPARPWDAK